ncbi:MAG: N-acetylmuramoyl-L-alanine amidase [Thermoleophilia bacterium]|nr:N-acetylmuramoyl-L-alanine amidase [Thermoleophilia bacterium]
MNYSKATPYPSKSSGGRITPIILVLHTTEGYGRWYLDQLFSGQILRDGKQKISVHWCVYRDGAVVEYAPWKPGEAVRCIHAGTSSWQGRSSCNNFSLGVEIEHKAGDPYPAVQLQALGELVQMVKAAYPDMELTEHRIISPGRKPDPTAPWDDVKARIYEAWESRPDSEDDMTPAQEALLKRQAEATEKLAEKVEHLDNTVSQAYYAALIRTRLAAGDKAGAKKLAEMFKERWEDHVPPLE